MPYVNRDEEDPDKNAFFPICCDNTELGSLGPGYPLLFDLMRRVAWLMFWLTIIYFIPCVLMILDATKDVNFKKGDLNPIGIFSSGAFVKTLSTNNKVIET